jgi:hypothetical protein
LRIYEINTRTHCQKFDQITQAELNELSRSGFDAVWLMGVWKISEAARKISKIISDDFEGSPYAVPSYEFNPAYGGEGEFASLVRRARGAGLPVIADFVSNHMALDSPWIDERPELFIRSDPRARAQSTGEYFLHTSGELIAFGRDPYFPPWNDTAQLDYTNADLRSRMIGTLKWMSRHVDGVRCDMAMLVLRDYIRRQWYPNMPDQLFGERMPSEFWAQVISEVKAVNPHFVFIAEAYWNTEEYLLSLGFDLVYEKKLYDGLVSRNAGLVTERLSRGAQAINKSLCFIENHDEPRAAAVFKTQDNLAAAALILSLPGSSLIHEGQTEGRRERLPVQRVRPLTDEPPDLALRSAYERLLKATAAEPFKHGSFHLFDSRTYGVVSFIRQNAERTVAYLGQISDAWHRFGHAPLDISPLARAVDAQQRLRVVSLTTSQSISIERKEGAFTLWPDQLSPDEEAQFCLIEALPG